MSGTSRDRCAGQLPIGAGAMRPRRLPAPSSRHSPALRC